MTGGTAAYLVAAPFNEASTGFTDRIAIGPLNQLKTMSGRASAFQLFASERRDGAVPCPRRPSTSRTTVTGYPPGEGRGAGHRDVTIDYTSTSGRGQLAAGSYLWTGYIYVPRKTCRRFDSVSASVAEEDVSFTLDGGLARSLQNATSIYHGYYYGSLPIPVSPTVAGYIEAGLTNRECHAGASAAGTAAMPGRITATHRWLSSRVRSASPRDTIRSPSPSRQATPRASASPTHAPRATSTTQRPTPEARPWPSSSPATIRSSSSVASLLLVRSQT